jgi:hypothetical protein
MKRRLTILFILTFGAALLMLPPSRGEAQADLGAKIAAAKTTADHEAIAVDLEQEAKDLDAKAALHADMAKHYGMEQYAHQQKPSLRKHCEDLSATLKKAAQQAAEMAKVHRELALKAGK